LSLKNGKIFVFVFLILLKRKTKPKYYGEEKITIDKNIKL